MDGQGFGRWVGDDSAEAERTFHETLLRLRAEEASNQEVAEAVMRSPFVLALVWVVTARKKLRASRGARPPLDWEEWLANEPQLREEWRCETLYLLGKRLRARGDARCDLQRPSVGGYWRVKIIYAAIKAAWNLFGEGRLKVRRSGSAVQCYGDGLAYLGGKEPAEGKADLALDLMTAIGDLENARQREVMRLSLFGYTYQEIADLLTERNGPEGVKVTFEMIRGAFERAREILKKRLGQPAA